MDNLEHNIPIENEVDEKTTITNLYEVYRSKNGALSREAYEGAVVKAANPTTETKETYMKHVKAMADFSDMKLTPETLKVYAILRGEQKVEDEDRDAHVSMSDQSLLAEILYRQGDYEALIKLVKRHLHIFH